MMMKSNPKFILKEIDGKDFFKLVDSENAVLKKGRIKRLLDRYNSYFYDYDKLLVDSAISYVRLQELIDKLNKSLTSVGEDILEVDQPILEYIQKNKYAINEQRVAGSTIKAMDSRWNKDLFEFNRIIDEEITRPLKKEQLQASFYLSIMKRAANFSVPGSGKTAMLYGAFAYLSSKKINQVKRLLVVCPINAFEAWRSEFIEVFGAKRSINYMNLRELKYKDVGKIRMDWGKSNVITINYEALEGKLSVLNELIDGSTMIVFDEVHRVKGIGGRRAKSALKLGSNAKYHYVLTGTPIPNTYQDIYNFLHLLYESEYDSYFGWEVSDLVSPDVEEINNRIQPFFWRTNKQDLKVPEADPDIIYTVPPSREQLTLLDAIYENEPNILALYLRLLQASTNPSLLLDKLEYQEYGFLHDELNLNQFNSLTDEEREFSRINAYKQLNLDSIPSPKFETGIELIMDLVNEDKKVIVWGMFVKTMHKIKRKLENNGVSVHLIYGGTPKEERVNLINEFRDGEVEVLISNPNTLGESISLHQTVHDAVYFEYNFNLTFMLQSRDRIHRLGLEENQYTRYYYIMTEGDRAHGGFIDRSVYNRLKEKEQVMLEAIDGDILVPEVPDSYLDDVKKVIKEG